MLGFRPSLVALTFVLALLTQNVSAATFFIDNTDASCSDVTADSAVAPYCTITAAVAASADGDTLKISGVIYNELAVVDFSNKSLTFEGVGENRPIINGNHIRQIFISSNATMKDVTIKHLEFRNGSSASHGGAMALDHVNLTIEDSVFAQNLATSGYGGAIYINTSSLVSVLDSEFDNNESQGGPGAGGAICGLILSTFEIENSVFSNNSSDSAGALLMTFDTSYEIRNSEFIDNTADAISGALYLAGTLPTATGLIENTMFDGNYSGENAGAFYTLGHELTVTDSQFVNNMSALMAGAIASTSSIMVVENSNFVGNSSPSGGAIYFSPTLPTDTLEISNSQFSENFASSAAAAIYMTNGILQIENTGFTENASSNFAGSLLASGSEIRLDTVQFENNAADAMAGPYIVSSGALEFNNVLMSGNEASTSIAAGYLVATSIADYDFKISNSAIVNNIATVDTGGLFIATGGGKIAFVNSTISGNTAQNDHAAIHSAVSIDFFNSTIVNNIADNDGDGTGDVGGIYVATGTARLFNSILANNSDSGLAPDCFGNFELDHSLLKSTTGCTLTTTTESITGDDPMLGDLEDNGGDTLTHALLEGSPAISAGTATGCSDETSTELTTDQRGVARSGACDLGAYTANCGDGIKQDDEECDDGNTSNGDGCDSICTEESKIEDDTTDETVCGNSAVESGEECDDGNTTNDDGCSSACKNEESSSANAASGGSGGCMLQSHGTPSSASSFWLMGSLALLIAGRFWRKQPQ